MKNNLSYYIIWFFLFSFFTNSCVQPIDIKTTTTFNSIIVVEATITNEFKYQEIKLSRTFNLDSVVPVTESNANIKVVDNFQNTFNFNETTPGVYRSTSKFGAEPNKTYQIFITTSSGRNYTSKPTQLTGITQIDKVYAERVASNSTDLINIYVDSFDPSGKSKYYRYEYEETYKIIVPFFSALKAVIFSRVPPQVGLKAKKPEELNRICYKTDFSNSIIQTQTTGLSEDRVSKFLVRKISRNNYIISHRYSILVKQYVQSVEAYNYYRILNDFSSSVSLFSQTQTGFINGNVFSLENPNEKVIGFFEVSSVSTKRFFFNYTDFYPDEDKRLFAVKCILTSPQIIRPSLGLDLTTPLLDEIDAGTSLFWQENNTQDFRNSGPYIMVTPKCGDCTKLGKKEVPDFWIE